MSLLLRGREELWSPNMKTKLRTDVITIILFIILLIPILLIRAPGVSAQDPNNTSLSIGKATYVLGETVCITLAAAQEEIVFFNIISPEGIFYAALPSNDGEYKFKPDIAGSYVVNVLLRTGGDEKFLTTGFEVIDTDPEVVFGEPEQGVIEVGEPVNWSQHIFIANHGNVSISNYSLTIPLPDDYSNLSSDTTRCRIHDAGYKIDLEPCENLSFNISYQTSPVELEVVEASIDISDLIPSDAFDVGIYKEIGTGEEELEDVSSLSLTESKIKVKQVTVLHNSSMHYHNIPVCIEAEAEANTKVVELVNGTEKEIKAEISDKNASWIVHELSNRTFMITKREYIPKQAKADIDKPVEWQLNFSGTIIKYKTPAPFKTESAPEIENGTWKKEITIGSKASVHYSNVTTFTNLSVEGDRWKVEGEMFTKLFLVENNSRIDVTDNPTYNVSFVDTDDNGLVDRVQWNVPFLSNKTFEVEQRIEVINVQSYPTVGGNWSVAFNTTGKADLTITAVNGTTWSNQNEENDLKFLEVRHGDGVLDYEWIYESCSVLIRNFSSDETNFEVSKVLTTGKHTLQFRFGDDIEYAYNYAVNETEGWWMDTFLDESGIAEKHNVNVSDEDVKLSRISSTWNQTTQADFEAGALNQVDTSTSPGDVKLATTSTDPILVGSDNSESSATNTSWQCIKTLAFTKSGSGYEDVRIKSNLKATNPATAYSKIEVDGVEKFNHSTTNTSSYDNYEDPINFSSYSDGEHTVKLYLKTSITDKAAFSSIFELYCTNPALITSDTGELSESSTTWQQVKTLTFTKSGSGYDNLTIESDLKATSPKTAYCRIDVDGVEKFSHSTMSTSYESNTDFLDFSSYSDGEHTVELYLKTNSKSHAAYNFVFELYRTTPILEIANNSEVNTLNTEWHLVKTLNFSKSGSGYDNLRIDSNLKATDPATAYSKIQIDDVDKFNRSTDSTSYVSYKDFLDFSNYSDGAHTVKLYLKTDNSAKEAYNSAFELYKTGPTLVTGNYDEDSTSGNTSWQRIKTLPFTKSGVGYNELTIESNLKTNSSSATAYSSIRVDSEAEGKFSYSTQSTSYVSYSDILDFSNYSDGSHAIHLYLKTATADEPAYNSIFGLHRTTGYASQGTIASQVNDTGANGTNWLQLSWSETLRSGTDITFDVRASDTSFAKNNSALNWTSVGGTLPVTSGLPSGRYKQWRATLKTEDTSKTPILREVSIIYSNQDYQESGNLTSIEIAPSTLTSWDKFYANTTAPSGTNITFSILNAANSTLISGISPTEAKNGYDISSISESSIRLYASLNTTDTSNTSVLHDWNVSWSTGATAPTIMIVNVTFDNLGTDEASVPETGTGYHIKEGRNITVNATIANYGLVNVTTDFNVSFFDCAGVYGDWSRWFGNYTYNVTEKGQLGNASTGYPHNTTYAIAYWDPSLVGTHNISAWADPENTLGDASGNLTNNNGSALINVSAWQKYYGNVSGSIALADSASDSLYGWTWSNETDTGYAYLVNAGASINWSALHALGCDSDDTLNASGLDFLDADTNLAMVVGSNNATGFVNNNITELFCGGDPSNATNRTYFIVHGTNITDVPIVNSTDMTNHTSVESANFITGILWDDTKDTNGYYDTADSEDLIFIANVRDAAAGLGGAYHNYEVAAPCALNSVIGGDLDIYMELK